MDTTSLKENLKSLRANLESTSNVDPELKELLRALDDDIRQLLDKDGRDRSNAAGLIRRAQAISARLAVQHPHVEPALREVADTLARMGI
jgi:ABC-type transporter Mla subunit MlaD